MNIKELIEKYERGLMYVVGRKQFGDINDGLEIIYHEIIQDLKKMEEEND